MTLPVQDNIWGYGLDPRHYHCSISTKTCRPIYNVDRDRTWEDSYKEFYQNCKMLSLNKYFSDYVVEKGETTLPSVIEDCVHQTFNEYNEIIRKVSPSDFVYRFTKSVSRDVRAVMEKE